MKFWNANYGAAVIIFALLPGGVIAQTAPATKEVAPATKDDAASAKASAPAVKIAAPAPQADTSAGVSEPKPATKKRKGKKVKTADSAAPVEPSIPPKPCTIKPVMTDEMLKACGARPSVSR
jgi:hypothetical protein